MGKDPLTISDGCLDGKSVCQMDAPKDRKLQLEVDGHPCQTVEGGYQCGDHFLYSDAAKKLFYLPGSRQGNLTVFQNKVRIASYPIYLPQHNAVELAQWREKLLKQAESLARTGSDPIGDLLAVAEVTNDPTYYDRAIAIATSFGTQEQATALATIVDELPPTYPSVSIKKTAEILLPSINRIHNPLEKAMALNNVARVLQNGPSKDIIEKALKIARAVLNNTNRKAQVLYAIATTLAEFGEVSNALDALSLAWQQYGSNKDFPYEDHDAAYRKVLVALTHLGHLQEIWDFLHPSENTVRNIACAKPPPIYLDVAVQVADKLNESWGKTRAFSHIAKCAYKIGRDTIAKDAATVAHHTAKEAGGNGQARVLLEAAEALLSVGLTEAAEQLAQKIFSVLGNGQDLGYGQDYDLGRLARLYVQVGQSTKAKTIAVSILQYHKERLLSVDWLSSSSAHDAVITLVEVGEIDQALAIIKQMDEAHKRGESYILFEGILIEIVAALIATKQFDRAAQLTAHPERFDVTDLKNSTDIITAVKNLIDAKRYEQATEMFEMAIQATPTWSKDDAQGFSELWDKIPQLATQGQMDLAAYLADSIPTRLPKDRLRTLAAVASHIPTVPEEEQQLAKQALHDYHVLDKLTPDKQTVVWAVLQPLLKQEGFFFPKEILTDYATFLGAIDTVIHFRGRAGNFRTLYEFWRNRDQGLPVALLLYNTSDWNGAFDRSQINDALVQSGKFRVFYREVTTEQDFHAAIAAVSADAGAPIHTLVVAGHGSPISLQLGKAVPGKTAETFTLDVDDFRQGDFGDFTKHIDPKGQMLLFACSNGQGGKTGRNLANAFAQRVPPTYTIYSNQVPANIRQLDVKADRHLQIDWFDGPAYTLHGRRGVRVHRRIEVE